MTSLFFYSVLRTFLNILRTYYVAPIAASLFSLLLLLLLLLSEATGLVLGFAAVYYSPHVSHTYTRHFPTRWGVHSSFTACIVGAVKYLIVFPFTAPYMVHDGYSTLIRVAGPTVLFFLCR